MRLPADRFTVEHDESGQFYVRDWHLPLHTPQRLFRTRQEAERHARQEDEFYGPRVADILAQAAR